VATRRTAYVAVNLPTPGGVVTCDFYALWPGECTQDQVEDALAHAVAQLREQVATRAAC